MGRTLFHLSSRPAPKRLNMHTNDCDIYRQFAAATPDLPLFMQPWYLDAVCRGGRWDVALIQKDNRVVAALPYFLKQKWGRSYISMPPLCKQMGPFILAEFRTLKWEMRLFDALIDLLPPRLLAFEQNFNYSVQNWLPFYWRGFKQTCLYSYGLSLLPDEAFIFSQIKKNYRHKIRLAQEKLVVRHDLPLSELHRVGGLSFARQGLESPISWNLLQDLHAVLAERGRCQLFFAVDPQTEALHSASLLVWDNVCAYYLMSGDDPELRASGSQVLLKWAAIQYAKNTVGVPEFDFEGSMIPSIEQGRRDFGAQQKTYFRVWKYYAKWWKWAKILKNGWK